MYIITIDVSLCEGDGDCVDTCPAEVLALVDTPDGKKAQVVGDMEECLGCESCVTVCPHGAITLTEM